MIVITAATSAISGSLSTTVFYFMGWDYWSVGRHCPGLHGVGRDKSRGNELGLSRTSQQPSRHSLVSLVVMAATGRSIMGLMERCMEMEREMEGMGMMGGGMVDGPPLFLLLPVLFFWLLFLGVAAAVGVWAVRRYRTQNW
jgi:hypothetical protein